MNYSKLGLLIICRINSKRLNNKILKKINGKTLLEILLIRILEKFNSNQIVICSSVLSKNSEFKAIAKKHRVKLFYGEDKDIFLRMISAAKKFNFSNIVRITGDNPLTDVDAIIKMSNSHIKKKSDYSYTTNLMIGTRPEIIKVSAIKKCRNLSNDRFSSEYMTYFFLRKKIFKINQVKFKEIIKNQSRFCLTVDYKKDFLLIKKIFRKKNLFVKHDELLNFLIKKKLIKKKGFKRFIPLITKNYDASLKSDKRLYFIDLKKFGYN